MRCGARVPGVVQAHPHSAVSRCSEVWSPALPPSVRTGSGHSGTARTLGREARWSSRPPPPPSPPRRHPVGAPAHSSLPCSTWRWLMAPCVGSTRRDPLAPGGLLCVPTLRGNRPEPERSRPLATVGPGRDVTTTIEGRQIEALVPGDSCRVPSGVTSLLTGCGTQVFAWRTLSAPTHRTESRRVPDCTPGRELGDGLSGT